MKLEDQVCSLELAKRLKELEVKQESLYWWEEHGDSFFLETECRSCADYRNNRPTQTFSAFTVAELGEMLPGNPYDYTSKKVNGMWECAKRSVDGDGFERYANTEADARAKMLICLIENELLSVGDITKRD